VTFQPLRPNGLERGLIAKLALFPDTFNANISEEDEMYLYGLQQSKNPALSRAVYFRQGAETLASLRQIAEWKFNGLAKVPSFLEFACGHGRLTRYVIQEIPPQQVWTADIYTDALEFQRRQFGVHSFVSSTDPGSLASDRKFDLIFVVSLFTHLPQMRFEQWLRKLHGLLTPNGILALSSHDEGLAGNQPMPDSGFLFFPCSESRTLDPAEYGVAYVTEAFMRGAIARLAGADWPYHRIRSALAGAHDLYIVPKNPRESFATLRYTYEPIGYVDWVKVSEMNELQVGGWAGELNDGKDIAEVDLLVDDILVCRCPVDRPRPDVARVLGIPKFANSGWACTLPLTRSDSRVEQFLEVRAVASDGNWAILHLCPLPVGQFAKVA
jgi:SAM-dependent methyltransferase